MGAIGLATKANATGTTIIVTCVTVCVAAATTICAAATAVCAAAATTICAAAATAVCAAACRTRAGAAGTRAVSSTDGYGAIVRIDCLVAFQRDLHPGNFDGHALGSVSHARAQLSRKVNHIVINFKRRCV